MQEVADAFIYYGEEPERLGIPKSKSAFSIFHELADKAVKRIAGDMVLADIKRPAPDKTQKTS